MVETAPGSRSLEGAVALVAGATRGAGRGIARALGEAGATVYCTGRSSREAPDAGMAGRPETIEGTAERVDEAGGRGIAARVDHTVEEEVEALAARIREEAGRLDILVNDVWGGDPLTEWGTPFWELDLEKGRQMLDQAVFSHVITSRHLVPLLLETERASGRGAGNPRGGAGDPRGGAGDGETRPGPGGRLIVEVTDGDHHGYRGNLFYDLVKTTVVRLAFAQAWELRHRGVAAVAVTPGFLRSEAMLDHFGVTEESWEEAAERDPNFAHSETPLFVGRAVAALAADPDVGEKNGRVLASWDLAQEYGFDDADGRRPHWGRHFREAYGEYQACDDDFYAYWWGGAIDYLYPDWP